MLYFDDIDFNYGCSSVKQCRDGFAGDGEECELDPDLDAIPVKGLSCTLPNCRKVSSNVSLRCSRTCHKIPGIDLLFRLSATVEAAEATQMPTISSSYCPLSRYFSTGAYQLRAYCTTTTTTTTTTKFIEN